LEIAKKFIEKYEKREINEQKESWSAANNSERVLELMREQLARQEV
jgi:hypothetical protein